MEVVGISKNPVMASQPVLQMGRGAPQQEAAPLRAAPPEPKQEKKEREREPVATEQIAEAIQQYLRSVNVKLKFQIHEGTGEIMVSVINEETGEVVREVPPEQILNLAAKIDELIGTLFDIKI